MSSFQFLRRKRKAGYSRLSFGPFRLSTLRGALILLRLDSSSGIPLSSQTKHQSSVVLRIGSWVRRYHHHHDWNLKKALLKLPAGKSFVLG